MKLIEFGNFTLCQREWRNSDEVLVLFAQRSPDFAAERYSPSYAPTFQKLVIPREVWALFVELAEMSEQSYTALHQHALKLNSPLQEEANRATSEICQLLRSFSRKARVHDV